MTCGSLKASGVMLITTRHSVIYGDCSTERFSQTVAASCPAASKEPLLPSCAVPHHCTALVDSDAANHNS
jgi:hypothetical protein